MPVGKKSKVVIDIMAQSNHCISTLIRFSSEKSALLNTLFYRKNYNYLTFKKKKFSKNGSTYYLKLYFCGVLVY